MRVIIVFVAMGLFASGSSSASAQAILDGPLAVPVASPTKAAAAHKTATTKSKKTHHAAKPSAAMGDDGSRRDIPLDRQSASVPDDPLSLGMKWNGSNDNGSQTRVQNYNGTAAGTGAEVGVKLHF